jgi:hypothetical protein
MAPNHCVHGICALLLGVYSTSSLLAGDIGPSAASPSLINPFTLAVVAGVKKSSGEITYKYTHLRQMVLSETGQDGVHVQKVHLVPETVTTMTPLAGSSLFDAKGNKLSVDAFVRRARKGDVIVVYHAGRLPDPRYLRVFRDDTLVLVCGDKNISPISADPNPPPGYTPNPRWKPG